MIKTRQKNFSVKVYDRMFHTVLTPVTTNLDIGDDVVKLASWLMTTS